MDKVRAAALMPATMGPDRTDAPMLSRSMKLRAVAWDIDGTLVDSEPLHHEALVHGTLRWGVDLSDLPSQAFRGLHVGDVWAKLRHRMPEDLTQAEWHAAVIGHYVEHRSRVTHIPGAVATIEALAALGIPQVCVSNSNGPVIQANLDSLGVARHMRFVISLDDVSAGKPDPEPYRTACERLGLPPASVLAVEDSVTGATSASRAGLPVAFVSLIDEPAPPAASAIADLRSIAALFGGDPGLTGPAPGQRQCSRYSVWTVLTSLGEISRLCATRIECRGPSMLVFQNARKLFSSGK